ncbi:hypothetical protein BV898_07025 [Hypsibius exemplaris]|uniref:PAW domain-containing protein n=1 Tax=Hypsibius exemplaris TaxID=2072580 RepID=A0A1W0WUW6_HYPEX|nr:hypothetical protein BV898_07025 [Hypsibius exemplaris]
MDKEANLAYLGRSPDSDNAHARMDWRFDFTRVGLQIRSLQIRFPSHSFNEGCVNVAFYGQQGDGNVDHVDISETSDYLEIPEAVGWQQFCLSAAIYNEVMDGSLSQLFRQPLTCDATDRSSLYPLRITIDFDDVESLQYQF